MNFESLVEQVGALETFDLPLLVQAFDGPRESIRVQMARWMKAGRLVGLRRGMYTLPDIYRRTALVPARLANLLYRPSYLSGLWALGFYDLIPERVVWLTSVTTRVPRRFENPFGVFDYRNLKRSAFFGYQTAACFGREVLLADPEKALLDHWHLTPGEWTAERLREMRYQHVEKVSVGTLRRYAERFHSPRLLRAVDRWLTLTHEEKEGTVAL
jgi:predicted transcriptional regulator of viral defense system